MEVNYLTLGISNSDTQVKLKEIVNPNGNIVGNIS